MRGADTRHCWPRVNTGHRDREMWDGVPPDSRLQLLIPKYVRLHSFNPGIVLTLVL